jgi:hypothetical protein
VDKDGYTEAEKNEFDKLRANQWTRAELFKQKEWIKNERRNNVYAAINGELKLPLMKLASAILNSKGEANEKYTAYAKNFNIKQWEGDGVFVERKKGMSDDAYNKLTANVLGAFLQAGAIECCLQTETLETGGGNKSKAVDGDIRGNTMSALMNIFEDRKLSGKLEDNDFRGGIPSAKFIETMVEEIENSTNTTLTPPVKTEEKKEEPVEPKEKKEEETKKKTEKKTEKKKEEPKKKTEKKVEKPTGPEFLDIQDMTTLIIKLRQMTPEQEYRVDLNLDGKIWAEETLIFTKDKTGKKTLVLSPDGIKGTRAPLVADRDVQINYGPVNTTLKKIQAMINKIPNNQTPNNPNNPGRQPRPNPNAPAPSPKIPFVPNTPQTPNTQTPKGPEVKKSEFLDIQKLSKLVLKMHQMTPGQEYRVEVKLNGKTEKTFIFNKDKTGKNIFIEMPSGKKGERIPKVNDVILLYANGKKENLWDIRELINKKPNTTPTPNIPNNPGRQPYSNLLPK